MNDIQPDRCASTTDSQDHDRLAWRLTDILVRFNQGERLDPAELSVEYGVHRRTGMRDLTERFSFLPIEKVDNLYTPLLWRQLGIAHRGGDVERPTQHVLDVLWGLSAG